ncbi:hypothetical protein B0H66DRAFT_528727 [Apodospora peruviana]|uniref:Uncharacterized protein n=1 Tax=Apodospora peruviana TaxID=516989 RepID=A0AAE0IUB5_9PEZI|nr:hypothetical protein B0H66DRAFT_528727 [Apodospora peruviana]
MTTIGCITNDWVREKSGIFPVSDDNKATLKVHKGANIVTPYATVSHMITVAEESKREPQRLIYRGRNQEVDFGFAKEDQEHGYQRWVSPTQNHDNLQFGTIPEAEMTDAMVAILQVGPRPPELVGNDDCSWSKCNNYLDPNDLVRCEPAALHLIPFGFPGLHLLIFKSAGIGYSSLGLLLHIDRDLVNSILKAEIVLRRLRKFCTINL